MTTHFRPKATSEYLPFADRPAFVWTGGNDQITPSDEDLLRSTEPAYFIFDFSEPDGQYYFWKPKIDTETVAALRSVCVAALSLSKHFFVILANPILLHAAFENDGFQTSIRDHLKITAAAKSSQDFRRFCTHILVGCRFNKDTMTYPDGMLPWLSTVPLLSRFIWVDGALDPDVQLDNLKPCADDVPTSGDYDLFTGEVFWPGTYHYRDSDNAFQRLYFPLTFAIVEFPLDSAEALRTLWPLRDGCLEHDIPYCVVNVPQGADKSWGNDGFDEIALGLTKEIAKFQLSLA